MTMLQSTFSPHRTRRNLLRVLVYSASLQKETIERLAQSHSGSICPSTSSLLAFSGGGVERQTTGSGGPCGAQLLL